MKWIEAKPLAKIIKRNIKNFVWKNIVCQFGIPKIIITNNTRQLDNDGFKLFYLDLTISNHFSLPGHPLVNGQVEITNRTILRNLKTSLERSKGEWVEDLPSVLQAYHTTSRIPMGQILYSLVYGIESVISMEIGMPSFRTMNFGRRATKQN